MTPPNWNITFFSFQFLLSSILFVVVGIIRNSLAENVLYSTGKCHSNSIHWHWWTFRVKLLSVPIHIFSHDFVVTSYTLHIQLSIGIGILAYANLTSLPSLWLSHSFTLLFSDPSLTFYRTRYLCFSLAHFSPSRTHAPQTYFERLEFQASNAPML